MYSSTVISELYQKLQPSHPLAERAKNKGIEIFVSSDFLDFKSSEKTLRVSHRHSIYFQDVIDNFQFYFSSVVPEKIDGMLFVDFSSPRFHYIDQFELMPIYVPSFSEPFRTLTQYLEFSRIHEGSVVLDIGAYSGLSSIFFKEKVGDSGMVIAIEADEFNLQAMARNFDLYKKITKRDIVGIFGAIWSHNDGISFSAEGNMGSSACDIVGSGRGKVNLINSFTLSRIADSLNLSRVDFVKCDIEGGEIEMLADSYFFRHYKPRIIIECHNLPSGGDSVAPCIRLLDSIGYKSNVVSQDGYPLPLIQAVHSQ